VNLSYRIAEIRQRTLVKGQTYDAGYLTSTAVLRLLLGASKPSDGSVQAKLQTSVNISLCMSISINTIVNTYTMFKSVSVSNLAF